MEHLSGAVENLRGYLRIPSVQPNPDYESCVEYLKRLGEDIGLDCKVHVGHGGKPILIMSLTGKDPTLPSLLLNSHMDVVPVTLSKWKYPPFDAHVEDGKIYARGAQDMKSVGISYLEALRQLLSKGGRPERSVHLTFVPDEEIGGVDGMMQFVETDTFKELNIGFALDEGIPSPIPQLLLFDSERAPCWIKISTSGVAGHGSSLLQGTAVERLLKVLSSVTEFRSEQVNKLAKSDDYIRDCGKYTSVNVTMLKAGSQVNVIPDEASAMVDLRLSNDLGEDGLQKLLSSWTMNDSSVNIEFIQKTPLIAPSNVLLWWNKVERALNDISFVVTTFPGATDSRFLRQKGIPAIGISPYINTPILLHDHNEYIDIQQFSCGIEIHSKLISALAFE